MTSQRLQRPPSDRNFSNSNAESSSESDSMVENVLEGGTQAKRRQNALNRGEKLVPCTCQTFGRLDGTPHHVTQRVRRAHQARDINELRNERETSQPILQYHDSPPLLNDEMYIWNDNEEREGLAMNMNLHELSTDAEECADGEFSNLNDDALAIGNDIDEVNSTDNIDAIEDYPELYYRSDSLSSSDEETDSDTSEDSFGYEFCEGMCPLYFHCTYDARKRATCLSPAFIQILRN